MAMARGSSPRWFIQRFEHGSIYSRPDCDPVAVPSETVELVGDRLGWPLSQVKTVGDSGDETIQYFEKGIVTAWDGTREMWVRPTG